MRRIVIDTLGTLRQYGRQLFGSSLDRGAKYDKMLPPEQQPPSHFDIDTDQLIRERGEHQLLRTLKVPCPRYGSAHTEIRVLPSK